MKFASNTVRFLALMALMVLPTEASSNNLRSSNAAEEEAKNGEPRELHHTEETKEVRKAPRKRPGAKKKTRSKGGHPTSRVDASFRKFDPFNAEKLELALKAAKYSYDVYEGGEGENYGTLEGTTVHPTDMDIDKMALKSDEDYCWVIFAGTDGWMLFDMMKNLNLMTHQIPVGTLVSDDGCKVHRGFYRNYAGMGFYGTSAEKKFEPKIHEFLNGDACVGKQVIFTGHSLGGASALVGAMIWSFVNPIAITFGQPAVLTSAGKGICQDRLQDEEHIWRFINSEKRTYLDGMSYDVIPASNPNPHVGGFILLPPGKEDGTIDPPQNLFVKQFPKEHPDTYFGLGVDMGAHKMEYHIPKLELLNNSAATGGNFDTLGFIDTTYCSNNRECRGFNEITGYGGCIGGSCADGSTGDQCDNANQCQSHRCEWDLSWSFGTCYEKLGYGERCNENSDCRSNKCSWWFKCDY